MEFNEFVKLYVLEFYQEPIKLKSGKYSNYYLNWRKVTNNVSLLEELVDYIVEFTKNENLNPDCFVGVPEGATKIGLFTQYKWCKENRIENCILPMIRKEPKDHGAPKDKYFIGEPKGRTILIEDVATTGSSIIDTINMIKNYKDFEIIGIYVLTDRMEKRDEFINSLNGIKYYAFSKASDFF